MKRPSTIAFALAQYGALWRLARPVLRRHKRLREDFALRLAPDEWAPPSGGTDLWIQAASGGEAFLVRRLLDEANRICIAKDPQTRLRVLCTSCTRQGLDVLEGLAAARLTALDVTVRVFPLDEPGVMRRALAFVAPKGVVLLETELWPGLMAACAENSVPVAVVNGRMTEKSFSGYRWLKPLWRRLAPEWIMAMDEGDASRFAALFPQTRVSIMPNMKFDGIPETPPVVAPDNPAGAFFPQRAPIFLLSSVRKEEEELLAPVIAHLRNAEPQAAIVVAPRHMERASAWKELLERRFGSESVALRSTAEIGGFCVRPGGLVVWDAFGELNALYARARAVFVGGSLAPLGGQNFLEPAGHGRIPIIGPYWKNFSWVGEEFFTAGLGVRVASTQELGPAMVALFRESPPADVVRKRLETYVASRRGGSRAAAERVWDFAANAFRKRTYL